MKLIYYFLLIITPVTVFSQQDSAASKTTHPDTVATKTNYTRTHKKPQSLPSWAWALRPVSILRISPALQTSATAVRRATRLVCSWIRHLSQSSVREQNSFIPTRHITGQPVRQPVKLT